MDCHHLKYASGGDKKRRIRVNVPCKGVEAMNMGMVCSGYSHLTI